MINFYYPKTLHRSVIADMGITTPKQLAKMMVKFTVHHPELRLSKLVISQVPGSMPRSSAPHGVVESFLKSKKYIVPSAIASPIFAGCVFAVFVGTGAGRFEPDRDALVFSPGGDPESPMTRADRKAYENQLKRLLAETGSPSCKDTDRAWEKLQGKAHQDFDEQNRPILKMEVGERLARVGVSAENVLDSDAPPQLVEQMLAARLRSELRRLRSEGFLSLTSPAIGICSGKQCFGRESTRTIYP